jgi:hypothetical protein
MDTIETSVMPIPSGLMYLVKNGGQLSLEFVECDYELGNYIITVYKNQNYNKSYQIEIEHESSDQDG